MSLAFQTQMQPLLALLARDLQSAYQQTQKREDTCDHNCDDLADFAGSVTGKIADLNLQCNWLCPHLRVQRPEAYHHPIAGVLVVVDDGEPAVLEVL